MCGHTTNQNNGSSTNEDDNKEHSILFDDLCWEVLERVRAEFVLGKDDSQ